MTMITLEKKEHFLATHRRLFSPALSEPRLPDIFREFVHHRIWVCMEISYGEKAVKLPINPHTGELAKSNDSTTWGTFTEAKNAIGFLRSERWSRYRPQYIAITLKPELGVVCIDLDNVISLETGEINKEALEIVRKLNSYTEISVSGTGFHIFVKGYKNSSKTNCSLFSCKEAKIEVFDNKFLLVTNKEWGERRPLRNAQVELDAICDQYLGENQDEEDPQWNEFSPEMSDEEVLQRACKATNGDKIKRLYYEGDCSDYAEDESRADMALMTCLAFWTQDMHQLERIFSRSALGQRKKWNQRLDYRRSTIKKALSVLRDHYSNSSVARKEKVTEERIAAEQIIKALSDNEVGDAALFLKQYRSEYLYDPYDKEFYHWNGSYWEIDKSKTRHENLRSIAKLYDSEAQKAGEEACLSRDEEKKKTWRKLEADLKARSYALKGIKRLNNVLEVTTHGSSGISFTGTWDDSAGLLPCVNGIVDLKTGALLPHEAGRYIRKICPTPYDPNAKCPLFEKFLEDITLGDSELKSFFQRLFGYAILGVPVEHVFVILFGEHGRNGKGTLMRTLSSILGESARTFSPEMLLLQRNPPSSGTPRADLIHLQGVRLAIFSEINKNRKLDSSVVKNLSGGDTVCARRLFSNFEQNFTPSHTLFIQTNCKPQAPADDNALWRRAILVPFNAEFWPEVSATHHKVLDPNLEEKLKKESTGILRWLVQGAMEYQRSGLNAPARVKSAVDEYRSENDGIGVFLNDHCKKMGGLSVKCSELREKIRKFCEDEGYQIPTPREVTAYLLSKGFQKTHLNHGDYWMGIAVNKAGD